MLWLRLTLIGMLAALLPSACGGREESPEDQIRNTIDSIQQAAEDRSLSELMSYVDPEFREDSGLGFKQVRGLVQLEFVRNPKIHSFKVIRDIHLRDDQHASATVVVALAGRPIDNASALTGLRAEMMRFDLEFEFTDQWRVKSGRWQRAGAADFL